MKHLKRRKREKFGTRVPERVISPGHLQWVRGFPCTVAAIFGPNACNGRVQSHHVKTRGAGGGDDQVVPLCVLHHAQLDSPGWSSRRFEAVYGIDMKRIAAWLWDRDTRHRLAWERKVEAMRA